MGEPAVKAVPQQTFRVGKPVSLQLTGENLHGHAVNLIEEPSAEYGGSGLTAATAGRIEVTTAAARTGTHSWRVEKTAPVLDHFNRANGGLGANWTTLAACKAPQIISEEAACESAGAGSGAVWNESFPADQIVFASLPEVAAGGMGVLARSDTERNGYIASYEKGTLYISKLVNSVETILVSKALTLAVNDVISFTAQGETLKLSTGTSTSTLSVELETTDKTFTGGGHIGILMYGTEARIDSFGGGALSGSMNAYASSGWLATKPSETVCISAYFRPATVGRSVYTVIQFADSEFKTLQESGGFEHTSVPGEWTRSSVIKTAPANTAYARPLFYVLDCEVGEFHYIDDLQFTEDSEPPEYADGDQSGCEWDGEPGKSISYQQPVWSAEGLPPGLSIDTETGLIEGTPKTTGTYTVTSTGYGDGTEASTSFTVVVVSGNPASIMPSTPTVPRNPFSYFSYDFLTGEPVGQIPLRGVKFGQQLNIAGQASGQLDLTDLRVRETNPLECTVPNKSLIVVDFRSAPVWGGPVMPRDWMVEGSSSASQRTLEVQLAETICYLAHRVQATDYSAPPYSGISGTEAMDLWRATPWDAGLIACQLLQDMLRVPYGDPLGGLGLLFNGEEPKDPVAPEDDWVAVNYPYTSAQMIETIIKELAELPLGASFDLGLDLAYRKGPGSALTGTVNVDYPRRGRTFAENNLVIDVSTSRGYKIPEDGSGTANQVYEIGGSGAIVVAENVNPLDQGYALWERVMSRASAQSQHIMQLLKQAGTSDLAIYSYAPVAPTVRLSVFDPNLPLGSFITGDDVLLCIPVKGPDGGMFDERFPAGLEQEWRITGWEVDAKDEGDPIMTLTLAQPPYLEALAPAV